MAEEKILDRIRKLLEVTTEKGATEAEMETAMKMAQQLMMRHNIDHDNVLISESDIDITEVENQFEGHETRYWLWDLLKMIGEPYCCTILRQKRHRKGLHPRWKFETYVQYEVYKIIGTREDRTIVKEIFTSILPIVRNLRIQRWKEYLDITPKHRRMKPATFAKSYFIGFIRGLNEKLQADRDQFLADQSDRSKWGLIVVKKTDIIDRYVQTVIKPKTSSKKGTEEINEEAYLKGLQDGQERNGNLQLMQGTKN